MSGFDQVDHLDEEDYSVSMGVAGYLTVGEVAAELEISQSGVYKLIARGKLKAIRRSERGMRVSRIALDAYRRRLGSGAPSESRRPSGDDRAALTADFRARTGSSPEGWLAAWRAERIEDSPTNMSDAMVAMALLNWEHSTEVQRSLARAGAE